MDQRNDSETGDVVSLECVRGNIRLTARGRHRFDIRLECETHRVELRATKPSRGSTIELTTEWSGKPDVRTTMRPKPDGRVSKIEADNIGLTIEKDQPGRCVISISNGNTNDAWEGRITLQAPDGDLRLRHIPTRDGDE